MYYPDISNYIALTIYYIIPKQQSPITHPKLCLKHIQALNGTKLYVYIHIFKKCTDHFTLSLYLSRSLNAILSLSLTHPSHTHTLTV